MIKYTSYDYKGFQPALDGLGSRLLPKRICLPILLKPIVGSYFVHLHHCVSNKHSFYTKKLTKCSFFKAVTIQIKLHLTTF